MLYNRTTNQPTVLPKNAMDWQRADCVERLEVESHKSYRCKPTFSIESRAKLDKIRSK